MKSAFYLPFFACIAFPLLVFSQTPEKNLSDAVVIYNAMQEYISPLNKPEQITNTVLTDMQNRVTKGIGLLDKVIADGTAEQIRTARYFKTLMTYKFGFVYGIKGDTKNAAAILQEITADMERLASPSEFPFRYRFDDKNYIIKYEDFVSTLHEYYASRADLANMTGKTAEMLDYARRSVKLEYNNPNDFLYYLGYYYLLREQVKKGDFSAETAAFAFNIAQAYDKMPPENQETINKAKSYQKPVDAQAILKTCFEKNPAIPEKGRYAGETALLLDRRGHAPEALDMYKIAFEARYNSIMSQALTLARSQKDRAFAVQIVDRMATTVSPSDCNEYDRLAGLYTEFGAADKSAGMRDKASKCRKSAEEQAERERRAQHRREHPFNMYVGAYILPLFTSVDKMDFGGHVDFRGRRTALSFGYVLIQQRKDIYKGSGGDFRWDGYKGQFAVKVFSKGNPTYSGIMVAYADKKFPAFDAEFYQNGTGNAVIYNNGNQIKAVEKQYELLYNFGFQVLGKGLGMDVAFGIGGSYNQFDPGVPEYDNPDYTSNISLLNDRKPDAFNLQLRFAISMGLNFGPKRK